MTRKACELLNTLRQSNSRVLKTLADDRHEVVQERAVSRSKHLLCVGCDAIADMRSPHTRLHTFSLYQIVTLKADEVRTDRIICDLKLIGDLIHCSVSRPKQTQYLATCAFE